MFGAKAEPGPLLPVFLPAPRYVGDFDGAIAIPFQQWVSLSWQLALGPPCGSFSVVVGGSRSPGQLGFLAYTGFSSKPLQELSGSRRFLCHRGNHPELTFSFSQWNYSVRPHGLLAFP